MVNSTKKSTNKEGKNHKRGTELTLFFWQRNGQNWELAHQQVLETVGEGCFVSGLNKK